MKGIASIIIALGIIATAQACKQTSPPQFQVGETDGDTDTDTDADTDTDTDADTETETEWDTESDPSPLGENLLENPGAENGTVSGWSILENGGDGWAADEYGSSHTGAYVFATSSSFCSRMQMLDLLELGFTEGMLDYAPPVQVEEWIRETGFGHDNYRITVELLDADEEVLDSWEVDDYTPGHTNSNDFSDDTWLLEGHTFTDYGPGLRYIYFEDYGDDYEDYNGHYGPKFDDALVTIGELQLQPKLI